MDSALVAVSEQEDEEEEFCCVAEQQSSFVPWDGQSRLLFGGCDTGAWWVADDVMAFILAVDEWEDDIEQNTLI